jgi:hypothetical protein
MPAGSGPCRQGLECPWASEGVALATRKRPLASQRPWHMDGAAGHDARARGRPGQLPSAGSTWPLIWLLWVLDTRGCEEEEKEEEEEEEEEVKLNQDGGSRETVGQLSVGLFANGCNMDISCQTKSASATALCAPAGERVLSTWRNEGLLFDITAPVASSTQAGVDHAWAVPKEPSIRRSIRRSGHLEDAVAFSKHRMHVLISLQRTPLAKQL